MGYLPSVAYCLTAGVAVSSVYAASFIILFLVFCYLNDPGFFRCV